MGSEKPKKVSAIASCFNGAKYLPKFLENAASQTLGEGFEVVLVHNEPGQDEIILVQKFMASHPGLIKHIVVPREKLAVSTNRAIKAAAGEYVCVWNVDDLRTPNSLELMAKTLDENSQAGFTYGDFIVVNKWLETYGEMVECPEFSKKEFIRSMYTGPFYMWRKALCTNIGYWDEQCLQGADFDYSSRLAVESDGKKTHGLLGYYLNEGLGLSTKRATLQPIERTFIELRFGVYHKLNFWYYKRAKKYRVDEILFEGKWINKETLMPHWKHYAESKCMLIYAGLRYPFWVGLRVLKKLINHIEEL